MVRAGSAGDRPAAARATTLTVTADNLPQSPDVVRWASQPRRASSTCRASSRSPRSVAPARDLSGMRGGRSLARGRAGPRRTRAPASRRRAARFWPSRLHPGRCRFLALQRPGEAPAAPPGAPRGAGGRGAALGGPRGARLAGVAFRDDDPWRRLARTAGLLRRAGRWWPGPGAPLGGRSARHEAGAGFARLAPPPAPAGPGRRLHRDQPPLHEPGRGRRPTSAASGSRPASSACPYRGEMVPMCQMNAGGGRGAYAEILADRGTTPAGQDARPAA